ncbi:Dynein light chain 4, axonemal [Atta colombica]|nr:Dynein light chain 4, axonemal [Atta colombica]
MVTMCSSDSLTCAWDTATVPLYKVFVLALLEARFAYKIAIMTEVRKDDIVKILHTYPFCRKCDMSDEMKQEAMELCVTAAEKYADNYESVSRMIKETMDKKFGASWHTVVGEGYGFEITYQLKHLLYMYCAGNLAICIWKSA